MNELALARDLAIVGLAAFLGGFVAKKLSLPIVLGYIGGGLYVNAFAGNFIQGKETLSGIANIGVALLLFSLGIEFSLQKLLSHKEASLLGASVQIILTTLMVMIIGLIFHLSLYEAFFMGSVFSLSSTAIVVKLLSEKGELETLPGEISTGWLLLQDLAVLPLSLLLPVIGRLTQGNQGVSNGILELGMSLGKTALILAFILYFGKKLMPKVLNGISSLNSRELLLIAIISLSIFSAYLTLFLGLSFALGAFLAGLLIARSIQNHAIFTEIRPVRDLFVMTFFVLLGMLVDLNFVIVNARTIIVLSLLVILIKYLIVLTTMRLLKYHVKVAHKTAINLISVGEFAFVLALGSVGNGLISSYLYSLIISVALATIGITPIIMNKSDELYQILEKTSSKYLPGFHNRIFQKSDFTNELPFENHVVICGYGRVGRHIGEVLKRHQIPFVVVEYNHRVVHDLKDKAIPVVYGDPTEYGVLDFAQVDKAKIVVVAIPDRTSQEQIIVNSLSLNKNVVIICRSHIEEDRDFLLGKGAKVVVQPEFEASLSISHKVLEYFSIPKETIVNSLKTARGEQENGKA